MYMKFTFAYPIKKGMQVDDKIDLNELNNWMRQLLNIEYKLYVGNYGGK